MLYTREKQPSQQLSPARSRSVSQHQHTPLLKALPRQPPQPPSRRPLQKDFPTAPSQPSQSQASSRYWASALVLRSGRSSNASSQIHCQALSLDHQCRSLPLLQNQRPNPRPPQSQPRPQLQSRHPHLRAAASCLPMATTSPAQKLAAPESPRSTAMNPGTVRSSTATVTASPASSPTRSRRSSVHKIPTQLSTTPSTPPHPTTPIPTKTRPSPLYCFKCPEVRIVSRSRISRSISVSPRPR